MIIEDDYDSEIRYGAVPLPTIAELTPDRTVYLGTVSKTLGAGIRLGWMVASQSMGDRISATRRAIGDHPSVLLQPAMTSMLCDGEWDRTVRTARPLYRTRDHVVAAALARFGELRGIRAGLHTVLILDTATARDVAISCATSRVDVPILDYSTRSHTARGGIVVGYGSISDDELDYAISILVEAPEAALLS
ncbi:Transcriptional regulator, GntR family/aminotransferase, classes I and II [Rhodococcus sp. AW25M09]|nr:Transcriptional regulator, GntR family/aminotransferase, classes I and II [Rhodococcus sp. AW25M09]